MCVRECACVHVCERETEHVRGDSERSGVREGARDRVCDRRRQREFVCVCVS